jgi:hypothetical protein
LYYQLNFLCDDNDIQEIQSKEGHEAAYYKATCSMRGSLVDGKPLQDQITLDFNDDVSNP